MNNEDFKDAVWEVLHESIDTFSERNAVYGQAHARHGNILNALFPEGVVLKTPEDFTRFMLFNSVIGKLNRYAENFSKGGHKDSVVDPINALAMLAVYDETFKNENS